LAPNVPALLRRIAGAPMAGAVPNALNYPGQIGTINSSSGHGGARAAGLADRTRPAGAREETASWVATAR
jgi:hypothetical protein